MDVYLDVLMNVVVIWTVASITPGANVILTINSALSTGRGQASGAAVGASLAVMLWGALGASGLLVVLNSMPALFTVMKVLGGGYLIYLGISRCYRAHKSVSALDLDASHAKHSGFYPLLRHAFITSILNPKTGLFVVSLFSLAMPATMTVSLTVTTMLVMGGITLLWHSLLVVYFSQARAQALYRRSTKWVDYATGGLFTLFGVKVLSS
ncbi:LysE family transporter [Photobacterium japonica]|uniref:LysE family translocator n=1 Tax=Photobacterium japonica TaxID=2910235 RepID=UPI003D131A74